MYVFSSSAAYRLDSTKLNKYIHNSSILKTYDYYCTDSPKVTTKDAYIAILSISLDTKPLIHQ